MLVREGNGMRSVFIIERRATHGNSSARNFGGFDRESLALAKPPKGAAFHEFRAEGAKLAEVGPSGVGLFDVPR
jgi:hypothetical protein